MIPFFRDNQRRAVFDDCAFVRYSLNESPVRFDRIDVRESGLVEGLDGWGSIRETCASSRTFWIDPIGRRFNSLREAMRSYQVERSVPVA
jgi:hypothetical protein